MHEMMTPSDFRSYAGTTALRRGFNGKQPRTRTIALSATICTRADGTQYIIEPGTRKSTTRKSAPKTYVPATNRFIATLPSIHV
jgi:hypothetical protein